LLFTLKKTTRKRMTIKSFLLGILLLLAFPSFGNLDSLNLLLDESISNKNVEDQLILHSHLGKEFLKNDSFDLSSFHFQKAIELARSQKNYISLSENLLERGHLNSRQHKYSESLEDYFSVLDIPSEFLTNEIKATTYNRIGIVYKGLGNFDNAYKYQLKSLNIYEIENDSIGISRGLYAIGTIFYYQNQYEESLKYYLKCLEFAEKLNKKKSIYACYEALGSLYSKMGNNEKSYTYTLKSLNLARELNYKTGIAYGLGNLATDKAERKEYQDAEKLFKESIKLKEELADKWGIIGSYQSASEMYLDWGKPEKAIECLKNAENISLEIESKSRLLETYGLYKKAYTHLDQYKTSLEYIEKYVALKDTIFNDEMAKEMGQAKNRYEIEQKENEIALLKKENELADTNKQLQKLQKYIFIIIALFLLVFSYVIFSRLKLQKSTNSLLEEKNKQIQIQNSELKFTHSLLTLLPMI